jgi:hypothetical protein
LGDFSSAASFTEVGDLQDGDKDVYARRQGYKSVVALRAMRRRATADGAQKPTLECV